MWKGIISLNDISAPLNCAFTIPKFVLILTILGPAQKAGCQLPKIPHCRVLFIASFCLFVHTLLFAKCHHQPAAAETLFMFVWHISNQKKRICLRIYSLMTNPLALLIRDGNSKKARWQTVSQLINFYSFGNNYWICYQRSRLVSRNFLLALSKSMPPKIPCFKFFGKLVH